MNQTEKNIEVNTQKNDKIETTVNWLQLFLTFISSLTAIIIASSNCLDFIVAKNKSDYYHLPIYHFINFSEMNMFIILSILTFICILLSFLPFGMVQIGKIKTYTKLEAVSYSLLFFFFSVSILQLFFYILPDIVHLIGESIFVLIILILSISSGVVYYKLLNRYCEYSQTSSNKDLLDIKVLIFSILLSLPSIVLLLSLEKKHTELSNPKLKTSYEIVSLPEEAPNNTDKISTCHVVVHTNNDKSILMEGEIEENNNVRHLTIFKGIFFYKNIDELKFEYKSFNTVKIESKIDKTPLP